MLQKLFKVFLSEIAAWFLAILYSVPGRAGSRLRYVILKPFFASCGKNIYIETHVDFKGFKNIKLGCNVSFGPNSGFYACGNGDEMIKIGDYAKFNTNVMINADYSGRIEIGNHVLVGPYVVMRASNHIYKERDKLITNQGHQSGRIVIEDDVWIGANAVITPNVIIEKGAVIAAGALLTSVYMFSSVVGGVPAAVIGRLELSLFEI